MCTDLVKILESQWEFSLATFGPGRRTAGVIAHIRKELDELAAAPDDHKEAIDIAILTFDYMLRMGLTPAQIGQAYVAKLETNKKRSWPDWRTAAPDAPIEHVRDEEAC